MSLKVSGNVTHKQTEKLDSFSTPHLLSARKGGAFGESTGSRLTSHRPLRAMLPFCRFKFEFIANVEKSRIFVHRHLDFWFLIKNQKIWQKWAIIQDNNVLGFGGFSARWVWQELVGFLVFSLMSPAHPRAGFCHSNPVLNLGHTANPRGIGATSYYFHFR